MKFIIKQFTKAITAALVFISVSTFATDIPDPEVLAKQYLKDLCTLNEQDFTRKYMLTQADAVYVIDEITISSKKMNRKPSEKISDSLVLRAEIHKIVVASYRSFKEWQHENKIDSSKVMYALCEFELKHMRKIPFYTLSDLTIYFTVDSLHYSFPLEQFIFIKTKWIGGEANTIYATDQYFKIDYEYNEHYPVDSVYVSDYAAEATEAYASTEVVEAGYAYTKKDLKIQKKIDAYYRKIEALYMKKHA